MSKRNSRGVVAVMVAAVLMLSGCAGSGEPRGAPSASHVAWPDTDLGRQSAWVVSQLEAGVPDEGAWAERVSPQLSSEMPTAELTRILQAEVAPRAPFVLRSFSGATGRAVVILVDSSGEQMTMTLSVDPVDGKIVGIYFV